MTDQFVRPVDTTPAWTVGRCPKCHRPVQVVSDGFSTRIIGHYPRELTHDEQAKLLRREHIGLRICPA